MVMAMNAEDLQAIEVLFADAGPEMESIAALRRKFPHLSWTECDDSDVAETPFRSYARVDIHLLNSKDHCAQITSDPAGATGVIVARRRDVS